MKIEYVDGVKVLKLQDGRAADNRHEEDRAMLRVWQLLTGGHSMRDASVFSRHF